MENEMIAWVKELVEERDSLRRRIERDSAKAPIDRFAKKALFDKVATYDLRLLFPIERDGMALTFFLWLDTLDRRAFDSRECPALDLMGMADLTEYFIDELKDVYQWKLKEAMEQGKEGGGK